MSELPVFFKCACGVRRSSENIVLDRNELSLDRKIINRENPPRFV